MHCNTPLQPALQSARIRLTIEVANTSHHTPATHSLGCEANSLRQTSPARFHLHSRHPPSPPSFVTACTVHSFDDIRTYIARNTNRQKRNDQTDAKRHSCKKPSPAAVRPANARHHQPPIRRCAAATALTLSPFHGHCSLSPRSNSSNVTARSRAP